MRLERESALLDTLTRLVQRFAEDPPAERRTGDEPAAVTRARDYLEAHYAEEVSLATLAHVAGLSPCHLSRVFRLASPESGRKVLVFESEQIENLPGDWKARETYEQVSEDEFLETFELAPPGKPFEVYGKTRLRRVR